MGDKMMQIKKIYDMNGRIMKRPVAERENLVLPRVGYIKVGYKNEKGYPQSVDYFLASGKYAPLFVKAYGDKPQTIQVVFPDNDPGKVCCERYEYRDDEGRLIATGDGVTFQVWSSREKVYKTMTTDEYPDLMQSVGKRYPNKQQIKTGDGWSITLTLNFILPCVRGIAGIWQFTTKGTASTIPQIRNVFDAVLESKGYVAGIIFDLTVQYAKSQKPGDKSRYPVVSLVANESEDNVSKVKEFFQPIGIENCQKKIDIKK